MKRDLVLVMLLVLTFTISFALPCVSNAQKVHVVKLTKGQVIVEDSRPKEFTVFLLSEGGRGGVLGIDTTTFEVTATPSENYNFGRILSINAKERKDLPDIGYPGGAKSGIELRVELDTDIANLPDDAWITFNIYQAGAIGICPYDKRSVICGQKSNR